ncbi:hypothetical protein DSM104299_01216 [Baekduia alba]|uniref:hypothetical protein n=1 Tax=Baekduia alba TaxID=2997333 RepID=UPI0023417D4D|nr:hypothetical protein [Baekduia alba]WCB92520.1 hypothetical protein DSM104299_01216 [Baekduia alba]
MRDIPPDRRSTHELYEQFRQAGERRAKVERQVRRRTWIQHVPGPALGAVLAFLVVGGGIAVGTKVFVSDAPPLHHDSDPGRGVTRAPADRRVAQATAADPAVAGARWGMRVFSNDTGATCAVAGRRVGGHVGRVANGQFRDYPDDVANNCADLAQAHVAAIVRGDTIDNAQRTLLFGMVDRTVTELAVGRDGDLQPIDVAPDGTYLMVADGANAFADHELRVTRGAERKTITLQPSG